MTDEQRQWRARLAAAPSPLSTRRPASYNEAGCAIGRAMLVLVDEDRRRLDLGEQELYEAVEARWPGFTDWIDGGTLALRGWAYMMVRWLCA